MAAADANQANVEFFFRLLYDCLHGTCTAHPNLAWVAALLAKIWLWIVYLGYAVSVVAIFLIIYITMRLFELRKREEEYYGTVILAPDALSGGHPRWEHIQKLAEGDTPSEWKDAILEADILLDETLANAGYGGETVSDRLKGADRLVFTTLQDAWDAHKVRNQIAHEGSAFDLTADLTRRTLARYENVFREFKVVS